MINQFTKNICAVGVGNILEWYDFAIFGALADVLGERFFPERMGGTALIASLSLFGSAFFMRPVGGWLMGYVGDNYGRKRALEVSVATMVIPSFLMGCLPTFSQIGWTATVCLVLLRLLQGLAVGGEMTGAFVFTIEATNGRNRGIWGAVVKATGLSGTALGMGYVAYLRYHLSQDALKSWGWRVPFLSSLLMGAIAALLRSSIKETDEFQQQRQQLAPTKAGGNVSNSNGISSGGVSKSTASGGLQASLEKQSFLAVVYVHWVEILLVVAVTAYWCVGYYTCFIWMGYYMSSLMGENTIAHAWELNIIMTIVLIGLMPLGGVLGDWTCDYYKERDNGYRRVMLLGVGMCTVAGAPAFYLINFGTRWSAIAGQSIFAVSLALYGSCLPAFVVQQFSVRFRYSGVGIAYNLSNAIFAGTAPLIQTALVMRSHGDPDDVLMMSGVSSMLPAAYLCFIALVSTGVMFWAPPILAERRLALEKELYHGRLKIQQKGAAAGGAVSLGTPSSNREGIGMTGVSSRSPDQKGLDISTSSAATDMDTSSTPMIASRSDLLHGDSRPDSSNTSSGCGGGSINISINLHLRDQPDVSEARGSTGAEGGVLVYLTELASWALSAGGGPAQSQSPCCSAPSPHLPSASSSPLGGLSFQVDESGAPVSSPANFSVQRGQPPQEVDDISVIDDSASSAGDLLERHLMQGSSHGAGNKELLSVSIGAEYVSGLVRGSVLHYPVNSSVCVSHSSSSGYVGTEGHLSGVLPFSCRPGEGADLARGTGRGKEDMTESAADFSRCNSYV